MVSTTTFHLRQRKVAPRFLSCQLASYATTPHLTLAGEEESVLSNKRVQRVLSEVPWEVTFLVYYLGSFFSFSCFGCLPPFAAPHSLLHPPPTPATSCHLSLPLVPPHSVPHAMPCPPMLCRLTATDRRSERARVTSSIPLVARSWLTRMSGMACACTSYLATISRQQLGLLLPQRGAASAPYLATPCPIYHQFLSHSQSPPTIPIPSHSLSGFSHSGAHFPVLSRAGMPPLPMLLGISMASRRSTITSSRRLRVWDPDPRAVRWLAVSHALSLCIKPPSYPPRIPRRASSCVPAYHSSLPSQPTPLSHFPYRLPCLVPTPSLAYTRVCSLGYGC